MGQGQRGMMRIAAGDGLPWGIDGELAWSHMLNALIRIVLPMNRWQWGPGIVKWGILFR